MLRWFDEAGVGKDFNQKDFNDRDQIKQFCETSKENLESIEHLDFSNLDLEKS